MTSSKRTQKRSRIKNYEIYVKESHVKKLVKSMLNNQETRKILKKQHKKFSHFNFSPMRRLRELNRYVRTFMSRSTTNSHMRQVMSIVDVGYRLTRETYTPVNILFNTMAFGYSCMSDWQVYLSTPSGIHMLTNIVNDPSQERAFINMLLHARIMGVSPTDILSGIPNMGIVILDAERYQNIYAIMAGVTNVIARRIVYEGVSRV